MSSVIFQFLILKGVNYKRKNMKKLKGLKIKNKWNVARIGEGNGKSLNWNILLRLIYTIVYDWHSVNDKTFFKMKYSNK